MCTAISISAGRHFFGRTLDVRQTYGEAAVMTPRSVPLTFLHEATVPHHPAILGVGLVQAGKPLYFDAVNEEGLAAAALRFAHSAVYHPPRAGMHNAASFELIPWVLSKCRTLSEAAALLARTNITPESIHEELPAEPLHYLFADKTGALTAEPLADGLAVAENPFGVLTNEPPFAYHAAHMASLRHLSPDTPQNRFCPSAELTPFTGGLGAVGLPGDFTSPARFARAVFAREHAGRFVHTAGDYFRLTDIAAVPRGCVADEEQGFTHTAWTSCYDTAERMLYFTSAVCRRICCVGIGDFRAEAVTALPLEWEEDVRRLHADGGGQ